MKKRTCAACGRPILGEIESTIFIGDERFDYCHNDERSCYVPAVMDCADATARRDAMRLLRYLASGADQ